MDPEAIVAPVHVHAKLGSHDITKVMSITNRNGKGDHSDLGGGIGYLDTCKYPAG